MANSNEIAGLLTAIAAQTKLARIHTFRLHFPLCTSPIYENIGIIRARQKYFCVYPGGSIYRQKKICSAQIRVVETAANAMSLLDQY